MGKALGWWMLLLWVVGGEGLSLTTDTVWYTCPLHTNTSKSSSAPFLYKGVGDDATAECANITLPLDWNDTSGKAITFFVKKVNCSSGNRKGQVWLLNGGPGGTGAPMEGLVPAFSQLMEDYDIMIPDHRGTGRSSGLWCPEIELMADHPSLETIKKCIAYLSDRYGDDLHYFTTTNAALDLKAAIDMTATDEDKVFVYGLSYGTYWTQRYMVVAPDQADKITLDGVCPPDVCRIGDYYDVNANIAGSDFMTLCAEESKECRDSLGEFPMESMAMLMELVQSGKDDCTKKFNFTTTALRRAFVSLLESREQRLIIPPLINRLIRCNPQDIEEIKNYIKYQEQMAEKKAQLNITTIQNGALMLNIMTSELYSMRDPPPSGKYYIDLDKTLFFSADASTALALTYPLWNKYDPYATQGFDQYPESKIPLLLLNGELDPQSSHAWFDHAKEHYTNTNQHFVSIPYAVHGTSVNSPVSNSSFQCGMTILANFFLTGEIDTKCLNSLVKIDFSGTTQSTKDLSVEVFGTPNLWNQ
eukprot:CAMPEP_0174261752 /NCGR_PEP_ID=MMETSP0439-20130205/12040_1 /TAXON_ID=0 /ORGANISM="Stereomyxa ramosa, Strain Chinc5" /LENGTH=529 /DNA_ID=CAMNT_0015346299 /DNA_START=51 /DNA_END=1640 /DNA_ORIENTATION=-